MRCIYFDCFSGISGDMTLGALIDLGVPQTYLKEQLQKIPVSGYRICVSRCKQMGIAARRVTVKTDHKGQKQQLRHFKTIEATILKSSLKPGIKERSIQIFHRIAQVEAKIHQKNINEIHFHEIGAVDSLVDIVGTVIGFDYLQVQHFCASSVPLGSGFIQCEHGRLPVPVPATLALLKGVPVYGLDNPTEMVTPTGAAILTAFAKHFGSMPAMTLQRTGYGAGMKSFKDRPNMLRIMLGELQQLAIEDNVWIIEANIDDMNPEWVGFLMERLFEAGALDVAVMPIHMKKNRPGILFQVISSEEKRSVLLQIIFQESTTSGIRYYQAGRAKLKRKYTRVKTRFGTLKLKIFEDAHAETAMPEFEECKKIALQKGIPLKQIYAEALCAFRRKR